MADGETAGNNEVIPEKAEGREAWMSSDQEGQATSDPRISYMA
ncbi:hypothetical protein RvY_09147 [Ramazzottius varieornatus]|uniref:Uncharacterized protein n=1 Tax=Ramazzottius varieornatus TaxID=947166 RepID=A0A1D1V8B0_RAMVA|nr:hypothetical protein RvY_09147 [Ramazzottius varieornatus]